MFALNSNIKNTALTKAFLVKKMLEGFPRLNPAKDVRTQISLSILNQSVSILPTL